MSLSDRLFETETLKKRRIAREEKEQRRQDNLAEITRKKTERDDEIAAKGRQLEQLRSRMLALDEMAESNKLFALKKERKELKMEAESLEEQLIKE